MKEIKELSKKNQLFEDKNLLKSLDIPIDDPLNEQIKDKFVEEEKKDEQKMKKAKICSMECRYCETFENIEKTFSIEVKNNYDFTGTFRVYLTVIHSNIFTICRSHYHINYRIHSIIHQKQESNFQNNYISKPRKCKSTKNESHEEEEHFVS